MQYVLVSVDDDGSVGTGGSIRIVGGTVGGTVGTLGTVGGTVGTLGTVGRTVGTVGGTVERNAGSGNPETNVKQ